MSLKPLTAVLSRLICVLSLTAVVVLVAAGESRAAGCSQATASAASVAPSTVGRAVRCLVNAQRSARGLSPMRGASRLRVAAQRHAADMVARRYFEHVSLDGRSLTDRVRSAGYLSGAGGYTLGENIGWGEQDLASARAIVRAWMNSPPHRAVILSPRFREAGVGVVLGVPRAGGLPGATFVLDVGRRR